ncbi:hypothetical protein [Arcticibacter tournemirensis]
MNLTSKNISKAASVFMMVCLFIFSNAHIAKAQEPVSNVHIGFCYPLSTNGSRAGEYTNNASFHVLAGLSKEEKAFSYAGISNVVRDKVSGFQFAGISNHVKNEVEGFQFAGIFNRAGNAMKGFQYAGIYNDVDTIDGFQFAGLLNRSATVKGFQFAGLSNIVRNDIDGFQFAGFSNIDGGNFKGFQFAGFVNKVRDVDGFQFAGFVNVAKKVRGLQFAGFINIADSSDHSLALVNIIKNGEKSIGVTIDETQTTVLSFRSGGRVLYGIIGVGGNWKTRTSYMALEGGFGAHLPLSNSFRINAELTSLYLEDWKKGFYYKNTFRVLPSIRLTPRIELFGGPSLNFSSTDTEHGKKLIENDFWNDYSGDEKRQLFIGYTAGLQVGF